jgi:hypothetical protein
MINLRELYRYVFYKPVYFDVKNIWVDDQLLSGHLTCWYKLYNISGTGAMIRSNLDLNDLRNVIFHFPLKLEVEHFLLGKVIRKSKIKDDEFEYGIRFKIKESDQSKLIKSINLLQLKRKKIVEKKPMY